MRCIHCNFEDGRRRAKWLRCGCLLVGLLAAVLWARPTEASLVYVTLTIQHEVVAFDPATFRTVGVPLDACDSSKGIAITPGGSRIYTTGTAVGIYAVCRSLTPNESQLIFVGRDPVSIAISRDGAYAYVTNRGSSSVSVFATATDQVVATVPLPSGGGPTGIALTPDGAHAYVTNSNSGTVSVIDTATNLEVTGPGFPIPVGQGPSGIAVNAGTRAYVTNRDSGTVSVIDILSNQVVGDPIPVQSGPVGIAITPDGTRAYVTNQGSDSVSVIDTQSNQVTTVAGGPPSGSGPTGIAIDPDRPFAYVTNTNLDSVSVINTASNQVVGDPIHVGMAPMGIGIVPLLVKVIDFRAEYEALQSIFDLTRFPTTFTVSVENPSQVASVTWDFYGDGTVVTTTPTTTAQFTYTRAGLFHPTVTVFLTDGSQASATTTLRVQSPAEAVATTVFLVEWLRLPEGLTTSLVSKLDAAGDAIGRGAVHAACGQMHAFENELHALVQGGRLDDASAAPRLGEAQAIRFSLGCF